MAFLLVHKVDLSGVQVRDDIINLFIHSCMDLKKKPINQCVVRRCNYIQFNLMQRAPDDEDEEGGGGGLRRIKSVPELTTTSNENNINVVHPPKIPMSRWSRRLHSKISLLKIPARMALHEVFYTPRALESPMDGYETADDSLSDSDSDSDSDDIPLSCKDNLEEAPAVPKEKIIKRINSHKGMIKSYQLAHRLSCKWTTGAGPRIRCVRDYPLELQLRALEEVCLSLKIHHHHLHTSTSSSSSRHHRTLSIPTPVPSTVSESS